MTKKICVSICEEFVRYVKSYYIHKYMHNKHIDFV